MVIISRDQATGLLLKLEGMKSKCHAIGARVTIGQALLSTRREVRSGGSGEKDIPQNDFHPHFRLVKVTQDDTV
jgi:hypothetical protein